MKVIEVIKKDIDLNNFIKKVAKKSDCELVVDEDCLIYINGVLKVAYFKVDKELTKFVRQACKNVKLNNVERLSRGLKTTGQNRVFGYRPARQMSQFASTCSTTSMAKDYPLEHAALCDFALTAANLYKEKFPVEYTNNENKISEKVSQQWLLKDTAFTSGIINKNSVLQYHFDIGHVSKALSVMLTLKKEVTGGGLSIPEIDTYLELKDNSILIFDGQELLHGVTPILNTSKGAYRYTIVYYSLIQMWKCLTISEEIIKQREKRFEREHNRHNSNMDTMNKDTIKSGKRFNAEISKKLSQK